jgi:hypothetical protein
MDSGSHKALVRRVDHGDLRIFYANKFLFVSPIATLSGGQWGCGTVRFNPGQRLGN